MFRSLVVASIAFVALSALTVLSQPAAAGNCAVLSENALGVKQSETADRAQKQLKRKINRWADKNGYRSVKTVKSSIQCTKKGSLAQCTASAKVCG